MESSSSNADRTTTGTPMTTTSGPASPASSSSIGSVGTATPMTPPAAPAPSAPTGGIAPGTGTGRDEGGQVRTGSVITPIVPDASHITPRAGMSADESHLVASSTREAPIIRTPAQQDAIDDEVRRRTGKEPRRLMTDEQRAEEAR